MHISYTRPSRRAALALVLAAGFAGAALTGPAVAQDFPTRPITFVVPFGPGASNDLFTRKLSELLSNSLGQPVVVDNRPGSGGFTGSSQVARAAPDGYTLLEMANGIASFQQVMKVDLDPTRDLQPLAMMARSPSALVVPATSGIKTVQEFIDHAKANPDTTFYGATGIGTTQQLHAESFNFATGLKLKPVQYTSSADAQLDLVAGRLNAMFVTMASTRAQIDSGQLTLLAYTDSNYPPDSPKAPTFAELGIQGMDHAQIWWGTFAPAGTPRPILEKLNAAINEALLEPSFVELFAKSGATPSPMSVDEFTKTVENEKAAIADIIKRANIQIQ